MQIRVFQKINCQIAGLQSQKNATKLETETFADFSQALGQITGPYQGKLHQLT